MSAEGDFMGHFQGGDALHCFCPSPLLLTLLGVIQVNMTTTRSGMEFEESSEWELVRTGNHRHSKIYPCCPRQPYVEIEVEFQLRRRPSFASHLFVAPSVILCLVTPTVFALPPASFEKLTLGISTCAGTGGAREQVLPQQNYWGNKSYFLLPQFFLSGGMLAWLSGMRCRLACSPADTTATHYLLLQ